MSSVWIIYSWLKVIHQQLAFEFSGIPLASHVMSHMLPQYHWLATHLISFQVPIWPFRQHGACGFLCISARWVTLVTQHRINSPFPVPPFPLATGVLVYMKMPNTGFPHHRTVASETWAIAFAMRSSTNLILPSPHSLRCCWTHAIALLVTHLLSCLVMDADPSKRW